MQNSSRFIISVVLMLSGLVSVSAYPVDTLAVAAVDSLAVSAVDSLAVYDADSLELSDSAYMAMRNAPKEVKKVDKGRDVSYLVSARRQRAVDVTPFTSHPFMANTFASAGIATIKLGGEDYGFGLMGQASFGKWLHQDHALRADLAVGSWQDNRDGEYITGMELKASYMFNLSSYVGGYRTSRFCEIMVVPGVGYAYSSRPDRSGHALSAHIGANLNLRLFKNISFFLEPSVSIYSNGIAVSNAGNWRTWLSGFQTTCGLTYNMNQSYSGDSRLLKGREDGWFISLYGGPHYQNSELVYELVKGKAMGIHVALGLGKYYTDFFAVRYTAAFTRGSWIIYDGEEYPCNYFAARVEGMLDVVSLVRKAMHKSGTFPLSASVLIGPEIGYMYKKDQTLVVTSAYLGITGGLQAKCYLTRRFALFVEPRFSIVPYDAPLHEQTSSNYFRNYYDGILNCNFGIEFKL